MFLVAVKIAQSKSDGAHSSVVPCKATGAKSFHICSHLANSGDLPNPYIMRKQTLLKHLGQTRE